MATIGWIVGRFFVDQLQRENTTCAVTSERILIISGLVSPKVTSLNLESLTQVSLTQ